MNENMFMESMINTLKYDSKFKDKKAQLLPILRRSYINSLPQYGFVYRGRSGQRYENIEIRVPIPLIDEANSLHDDLRTLVEYVYEESDDYGFGGLFIKPKILTPEEVCPMEHFSHKNPPWLNKNNELESKESSISFWQVEQ